MKSTAIIDGPYRYALTREWDATKPLLHIIMLNPSTADAEHNDPTILACIELATKWGYGAIDVRNLFAYRTSRPEALSKVYDPVGPSNDAYLIPLANERVLCAWGAWGHLKRRGAFARRLFRDKVVIGTTKHGMPFHPLGFKYYGRPYPEAPIPWK